MIKKQKFYQNRHYKNLFFRLSAQSVSFLPQAVLRHSLPAERKPDRERPSPALSPNRNRQSGRWSALPRSGVPLKVILSHYTHHSPQMGKIFPNKLCENFQFSCPIPWLAYSFPNSFELRSFPPPVEPGVYFHV